MIKFQMSDGQDVELDKVIAACQKPGNEEDLYFLLDGKFGSDDLLYMLEGLNYKILSEYVNMELKSSRYPDLKAVQELCSEVLGFVYDETIKEIIGDLIKKETSIQLSQNKGLNEIVEDLSSKNPDFTIKGIDLTEMIKQMQEEKDNED